MRINIYAIERDNGDGRYVRRHTFAPFVGPTNLTDRRGFVLAQDTDGGFVATVEAPEGARVEDDSLVLPDSQRLPADEALA
jgi:hypothetical protein